MISRLSLAGIGALVGAAFLALPMSAHAAASTVTKECSAKYKEAKAAGTLGGKKWPQFLSECSASLKGSDTNAASTTKSDTSSMKAEKSASGKAPSCTAQYKAAKAAGTLNGQTRKEFMATCKEGGTAASTESSTEKTKKAATGTMGSTMSAKAGGHQTTTQICSAQYKQAKAAGTLGGKKWPQFLSECSDSIKNDKSDANVVPDEPKATSSKAATDYKVPTVDKNGKPLTPGQIAFRQRIHECSMEWRAAKAAGKLQPDQKWPQYWSACNARLKQQQG